MFDYCPVIYRYDNTECRDTTQTPDMYIGESRGFYDRCLMNTLLNNSYIYDNRSPQGGCYTVQSCSSFKVSVTVAGTTMDCPYGTNITVKGFNGVLQCPATSDFCRVTPCLNMCMGQGICLQGICQCNTGFLGNDCSITCSSNCMTCASTPDFCTSCYYGETLTGAICVASSIPTAPAVSISAPAYFSLKCQIHSLIITGNTNAGLYYWNATARPKSSALTEYINNATSLNLVIGSSLLTATTLVVELTATNSHLNVSVANATIKIDRKHYISASTDVGNFISIHSNRDYVAKAVVTETNCIAGRLTYNWTHMPSNALSGPGKESVSYHLNSIRIPAGSLEPGLSYVFSCSVSDGKASSTSTLQIAVLQISLVLVVDRESGNAFAENTLSISASRSYNPNQPTAVLRYAWSLESGSSATLQGSQSVFTIPAGTMQSGQQYTIVVQVISGSSKASKSIIIQAVSGSGGSINGVAPTSLINSDADYAMTLTISTNSTPTFSWVQSSGPTVALQYPSIPYLFIPAFTLSRNTTYAYNLKMSLNSSIASFQLSFTTSSGPICGSFTVVQYSNTAWYASINCTHSDPTQYPLSYTYGVVRNSMVIPLATYQSGNCIVGDTGDNTVSANVCDSYGTCTMSTAVVARRFRDRRRRLSVLDEFNSAIVYPDSLLTAITTYIDQANLPTYSEMLELLIEYINLQGQGQDLYTCVEFLYILASNGNTNPSSFESILNTTLYCLESCETPISNSSVNVVSLILGAYTISNYTLANSITDLVTELWMNSSVPGMVKSISNSVDLTTARFLGNQSSTSFSLSGVYISVPFPSLSLVPSTVYDVNIAVYPGSPSNYLKMNFFTVGNYENYTLTLNGSSYYSFSLNTPFTVIFNVNQTGLYQCVHLNGTTWNSGRCEVIQTNEQSVTCGITEMFQMYKLIPVTLVCNLGIEPIYVTGIILVICLVLAIYFACTDSRVREQRHGYLVYYPLLSLFISQTSNRRVVGCLQITAVLLCELAVIGALNQIFDETFTDIPEGFNSATIQELKIGAIGIGISQGVSILLMCLNQERRYRKSARVTCAILSIFMITVSTGGIGYLTYKFCSSYTRTWVINFAVCVGAEFLVFEPILSFFIYCCFRKRSNSPDSVYIDHRILRRFKNKIASINE